MRRLVMVTFGWVLVVSVSSVVTWQAIETAGQQILADPAEGQTPSAGGEISTSVETTAPEPTKQPTRKPSDRPTEGGASGPVSSTSNPTSNSTPTQESTTTQEPTQSQSSPKPVERTWSGTAGRVSVRCTGPRIELLSVTPNDGYLAEVESRDSERIEVHFEPKSDGGTETKVRATCSGGEPAFRIEIESDGGSDSSDD
jgi:hypothetical protein